MAWTGKGQTDIGCHREKNEDCFLVDNEIGLYLVADGMGGHPGGEVAAELVAHELPNFVRHSLEKGLTLEDPDFHAQIQEDVMAVNDLIVREGISRGLEGMGSTLVMLLVKGTQALVVHVGDSRCYRIRDRRPELLTSDHSPADSPNVLTKVMGMEGPVQGDIGSLRVTAADAFLLCSDGLSNMVPDETMVQIIDEDESGDLPGALNEAAKDAGGHDNITVIHVFRED